MRRLSLPFPTLPKPTSSVPRSRARCRARARRGLVLLVLLALSALPGLALAEEVGAGAAVPLIAPLTSGETLDLPPLDAAMPSPSEFLGYPLGERFTRYARIRDYLEALAAASERVVTWDYGSTYEDRPLMLLAISSPENLARLEEIREQRAMLVDPSALDSEGRRRVAERVPVVVLLAYGVHGNESSSAEAALATAYTLAAAGGPWPERLEDLVVLLDPLSNPDGRERYVSGYQQRRGRRGDPDPAAREHDEPWPSGRFNHYGIDLNRDWSWASQRETRYRLEVLREWQPQVYVDLHEMSSESTYFFPPSADPVNPEIDRRVVDLLETFGRGNAAAFDAVGWLYYKRESFDLFYPGYADSYASFRGAVGMTYEAGGGGRAGLVLQRADGSTVTLADRIARHYVASLATVATAAANRRRLMADFLAARSDNARRADAPVYLWQADRPEAAALAALLARHGLEVHRLERAADLHVRPLPPASHHEGGAGEQVRRFPAGSWVVPSAQPLGNLVRALLEPETPMDEEFVEEQRRRAELDLDTAFYDVTAWSLPLAFNVDAWVAETAPAPLSAPLPPPLDAARDGDPPPAAGPGRLWAGEGDDPERPRVGWLVPPAGLATYRAAARLQEERVPHRLALAELALEGRRHAAGTLFVPRLGAPEGTAALLAELAAEGGFPVYAVNTSYSDDGLSLGSDRMAAVSPARIGLVGGDGVQASSMGALWHLLDRQAEVPHSILDLASLGEVDLGHFDVLVLPDGGGYGAALDGEAGDAVERWLRGGGFLVAVGDALSWLRQRELTGITEWQEPAAAAPSEDYGDDGTNGEFETGAGGAGAASDPEVAGHAGSGPSSVIDRPLYVPGAVVATEMRPGHPLTVGLASPPPVLVAGTRPLMATGQPQTDVLTVAHHDPLIAGLAWPESVDRLAGSLLVGAERVGRGQVVVFAQEPGFRLFWRGTMPLFLNAVLFGPSLDGGGAY